MFQPYDWPLDKLRVYQPELTKRPDFDDFWNKTKHELAETPVEYRLEPYDYPAQGAKVYNLFYKGYKGAEIEGWLVIPSGTGLYPGLVLYPGYNSGFDGKLHDTVNMALHGYACLQVFVRGQGGMSGDNIARTSGHALGWLTQGILNPEEYYYRAVYMDAVRAIEVLAANNNVDPKRIGVMGGSQGGALSIVAAALSGIPAVVVADFPFLANFNRAIEIAPGGPYHEFIEYFRRNTAPPVEESAQKTLSYFDVMNHAPGVKCFTLMAMGLIDQTTPPSTVISVYNHLHCAKDISIWRYFGHEAIPGTVEMKLRTLIRFLQKE